MENKEKEAKQEFKVTHEAKKRELAFEEFKIIKLREELATCIYDTMNLVRKKQTRGYEEADEQIEESE
jgi:hypothetical protein